MKNGIIVAALLLASSAAQAQNPNFIVGTEPSLAPASSETIRFDGALFANFQQQLGERGGDDQLFSTNFVQLEAGRTFGRFDLRGRLTGSVEPLTTDDSYPALFRLGFDRDGNPLVDESAGQRYVTEAAVQGAVTLAPRIALHAYVAPVGVPAFGIAPNRLRASATMIPQVTLADEYFSFSNQATNVITAGGTFGPVFVEGSQFDYGIGGDELKADDDISATALRGGVQFGMLRLAASRAEFDDEESTSLTNVALTLARRGATSGFAATVSATQAENDFDDDSEQALLAEVSWQFGRNNLSARFDSADRLGLFDPLEAPELAGTTYTIDAFSFGYARDLVRSAAVVTLGVNVTYFQQPRSFEPYYGHKPQATVFFVKLAPRDSRLSLID